MSVWVKSTCEVLKNVDMDILGRALLPLGYKLDESIKEISNTWGKDIVACGMRSIETGKVQDIGFSFENEGQDTSLNVKGDFYYTPYKEKDFIDRLSNEYQKINVVEKARANGYEFESQNTLENGDTEIYLYAY